MPNFGDKCAERVKEREAWNDAKIMGSAEKLTWIRLAEISC